MPKKLEPGSYYFEDPNDEYRVSVDRIKVQKHWVNGDGTTVSNGYSVTIAEKAVTHVVVEYE